MYYEYLHPQIRLQYHTSTVLQSSTVRVVCVFFVFFFFVEWHYFTVHTQYTSRPMIQVMHTIRTTGIPTTKMYGRALLYCVLSCVFCYHTTKFYEVKYPSGMNDLIRMNRQPMRLVVTHAIAWRSLASSDIVLSTSALSFILRSAMDCSV